MSENHDTEGGSSYFQRQGVLHHWTPEFLSDDDLLTLAQAQSLKTGNRISLQPTVRAEIQRRGLEKQIMSLIKAEHEVPDN